MNQSVQQLTSLDKIVDPISEPIHRGFKTYNAKFDPLTDKIVTGNEQYAPTYWVATAGTPPDDDGPLPGDTEADIVIIGGGFTGLSTALTLAEQFGTAPLVLEANRSAWGCTSRNGGQGQNASGRLYRSQWIEKWGLDIAKRLDAEIREGFDYFKHLVTGIECDAQDGGHLYIAHRAKKLAFLENEGKVMKDVFGYNTRMLSREQLHEEFVGDQEAAGALLEPDGIGVHPLKLAFGYLKRARAAGAKVHTSSPVLDWETRNGIHYLRTPHGTVKAKRVAVATGGYTPNGLHPSLSGKIMPILSNSIVTRPLTAAELKEAGLHSTTFITDTRTLRHYYRLLPDGSVQCGSRSALTGADANNPVHLERLKEGLYRKFPSLRGIPIAYSWWGWVDVSHDMMPRIVQPNPDETIYYAIGYGGNGVSFSAMAGRRLAERIMGIQRPQFDLPIYQSPLPSHLFRPFRRLGQALLYRWYYLKDEML
ncbi:MULTISPECIES: NAD(P)/FAD-dependent oxidoreductase [Acinetobacter]|jgi:glycine/D-amino acid oxidase-like deaminating enzyme|uniref:FAD-binding oxidoreductase n=1 Tax=Acinetobacter pittii TaxID=48296 RepID=A0AAE9S8V0_ACIPI|nr:MULTISPECIES: FAD-dependent oxidoreductase [Acinetobacter]AZP31145.1 FAD-binding oxidoreductase [Acinetobacter pittii]EXH33581.1 pyridine nucleotide-disulfide oxidoreductase family protein [Acinetobacter sp. 1245249]EXS14936.1 pyridine nucleotide-disulfide oxidoreductase family protein [Acinetobacter sp. 883425]EYT28536.1 pyridine nucleotide-disulfide oxidoreductase family protein [Acinetobacter sp. 1564232]MBK0410286.1 FAD-dependent oxidoreductase [Acinetobacter pittii]